MVTIQEAVRKLTIITDERGLTQTKQKLDQLRGAQAEVTASSERQERATLSLSRQYETLQRRLDPVYRREQELARVERDLTMAQSQGLVSLARKNELLGLATVKYEQAAVGARTYGAALGGLNISAMGLARGLAGGVLAGGVMMLPSMIKQTVGAVGDLADAATRAGASAEKLQVLRQALAQNGGAAESADTALQAFNVRMGQIANTGAGPAANAIKALGLSFSQIVALNPDEKFDVVAAKLGGIADPARRAALAAELFGKQAGPELAAALGQGANVLAETEARMRSLGIVMSNETVAAGDRLGDKMQELTQRFSVLWQTMVVQGAVAVESTIQGYEDIGGSIDKLISKPSLRQLHEVIFGARSTNFVFGPEAEAAGAKADKLAVATQRAAEGMKTMADASGRFDAAFGDGERATDELRRGLEALHPKAKAAHDDLQKIGDPLDIRPAAQKLDELGKKATTVFDDAQKFAESFTQTLVSGLMRGDSLLDSLSGAVGNLSQSLASTAVTDLFSGNFLGAAVSGIGGQIADMFSPDKGLTT